MSEFSTGTGHRVLLVQWLHRDNSAVRDQRVLKETTDNSDPEAAGPSQFHSPESRNERSAPGSPEGPTGPYPNPPPV